MGPVVHEHRFVSVGSVSRASTGGAADGAAGDAGIAVTEVSTHGDEPLGFRVLYEGSTTMSIKERTETNREKGLDKVSAACKVG